MYMYMYMYMYVYTYDLTTHYTTIQPTAKPVFTQHACGAAELSMRGHLQF